MQEDGDGEELQVGLCRLSLRPALVTVGKVGGNSFLLKYPTGKDFQLPEDIVLIIKKVKHATALVERDFYGLFLYLL